MEATSCLSYHFGSNYQTAMDLLGYFVPSEAELSHPLSGLQARAAALVNDSNNWNTVQAVATALLIRCELTAREVFSIVTGAIIHSLPPDEGRRASVLDLLY